MATMAGWAHGSKLLSILLSTTVGSQMHTLRGSRLQHSPRGASASRNSEPRSLWTRHVFTGKLGITTAHWRARLACMLPESVRVCFDDLCMRKRGWRALFPG